jgi:hypothetical protein
VTFLRTERESFHNPTCRAVEIERSRSKWSKAGDYESAFCETDNAVLFKKVEVAEAAMLTRRDALTGRVENRAEWQSFFG